jgi:hypothetical protein
LLKIAEVVFTLFLVEKTHHYWIFSQILQKVLPGLNDWMQKNDHYLMAAVLLAIGAYQC